MKARTHKEQECSWQGPGKAKDYEYDVNWLPGLKSSAVGGGTVSGWNDPGFSKVGVEERHRDRELC